MARGGAATTLLAGNTISELADELDIKVYLAE